MLIPWILGLLGVIWYAATRRPVPSRGILVALSIPIYIAAGIVAFIAEMLVVVGLSRASADPNALKTLIPFLKLATFGGEIAISIAVLRSFARRKAMQSETGLATGQPEDVAALYLENDADFRASKSDGIVQCSSCRSTNSIDLGRPNPRCGRCRVPLG